MAKRSKKIDETKHASALRSLLDTDNMTKRALSNPNRPPTDKQRAFARAMALPGMNPTAAARMAGYSGSEALGCKMAKDPMIVRLIDAEREAYAKATGMTRKRVIDGFLRAVELAEVKVDSIAMTAAWREIGRLCGFYAPKVVKHQVSLEGEAFKEKLRSMTDEELLRLSQGDKNVLDGEFQIIEEADGNAGDGIDLHEELTRVR